MLLFATTASTNGRAQLTIVCKYIGHQVWEVRLQLLKGRIHILLRRGPHCQLHRTGADLIPTKRHQVTVQGPQRQRVQLLAVSSSHQRLVLLQQRAVGHGGPGLAAQRCRRRSCRRKLGGSFHISGVQLSQHVAKRAARGPTSGVARRCGAPARVQGTSRAGVVVMMVVCRVSIGRPCRPRSAHPRVLHSHALEVPDHILVLRLVLRSRQRLAEA